MLTLMLLLQGTVAPPGPDFAKPIVTMEVWDHGQPTHVVVESLAPGDQGIGGFPALPGVPYVELFSGPEAASWVRPGLDPTTVYERGQITVQFFAPEELIPTSVPTNWNVRTIVFRRGHHETWEVFNERQRQAAIIQRDEYDLHEIEHCGADILQYRANCQFGPLHIFNWFMGYATEHRGRPQLTTRQFLRDSPIGGRSSKWMAWVFFPGGEQTEEEFRAMVHAAEDEEWTKGGWYLADPYQP